MSIEVTLMYDEVVRMQKGPPLVRATFACTGLTASGANTLPFPSALPRIPRRVFLQTVGNGAVGVIVSLDTAQGATDPTGKLGGGKLGVDKSNIYVYIGNGTELIATVEY